METYQERRERTRLVVNMQADKSKEQELTCVLHKTAGLKAYWEPEPQKMTLRCRKCSALIAVVKPYQP